MLKSGPKNSIVSQDALGKPQSDPYVSQPSQITHVSWGLEGRSESDLASHSTLDSHGYNGEHGLMNNDQDIDGDQISRNIL